MRRSPRADPAPPLRPPARPSTPTSYQSTKRTRVIFELTNCQVGHLSRHLPPLDFALRVASCSGGIFRRFGFFFLESLGPEPTRAFLPPRRRRIFQQNCSYFKVRGSKIQEREVRAKILKGLGRPLNGVSDRAKLGTGCCNGDRGEPEEQGGQGPRREYLAKNKKIKVV